MLNEGKSLLQAPSAPYLYTMKKGRWIGMGLLGVGALFFSAFSILLDKNSPTYKEGETAIAMRQIGHALLLQSGDSTSRVLPVKQLSENTFEIAFQSQFTFVPDSLVNIVRSSLSESIIHKPYIVNVRDCQSSEVVYGFQIGLQQTTTLVPCLGREQVLGCYTIQLSFLSKPKQDTDLYYLYLMGVVGLGVIIASGKRIVKQKKIHVPESLEGAIKIGTYYFMADRRILLHAQQRIELSEKETKLLKIFATQLNQPVMREQLLKEVWEDEGVIVGRSLDVFVSKLRKKLQQDPTVQLMNIHGVGYSLKVS